MGKGRPAGCGGVTGAGSGSASTAGTSRGALWVGPPSAPGGGGSGGAREGGARGSGGAAGTAVSSAPTVAAAAAASAILGGRLQGEPLVAPLRTGSGTGGLEIGSRNGEADTCF